MKAKSIIPVVAFSLAAVAFLIFVVLAAGSIGGASSTTETFIKVLYGSSIVLFLLGILSLIYVLNKRHAVLYTIVGFAVFVALGTFIYVQHSNTKNQNVESCLLRVANNHSKDSVYSSKSWCYEANGEKSPY